MGYSDAGAVPSDVAGKGVGDVGYIEVGRSASAAGNVDANEW